MPPGKQAELDASCVVTASYRGAEVRGRLKRGIPCRFAASAWLTSADPPRSRHHTPRSAAAAECLPSEPGPVTLPGVNRKQAAAFFAPRQCICLPRGRGR